MANLSNINNKFIVTDGGQALVNQTVAGFNPDADDLIVGNLSGNTGITIASGSSAGNYGSIYFADGAGSSTASKAGFIRYEQNTSKMTIGINALEKIAIDLRGNVGIGITPNINSTVVNVIQLGKGMTLLGNANDDRATMAANLYLDTGTAFRYVMDGLAGRFSIEDGKMIWGTAGSGTADAVATVTTKMTLLNNGNLGIGTGSPGAFKLSVQNTAEDLLRLHNSTDGLDSLISFTNPGGTLGRVQGIDNGGLAFDTGNNAGGINSNAMFIDNAGNVGIGTNSPSEKLQVKGDICVNSESVSTATAEIDKIVFKKSHPNGVSGYYELGEIRSKTFGGYSGGLNFYTGRLTSPGSYASTFAMAIDNFGRVGIGTDSPDSYDDESDDLVVFNSTTPGITIATDNTSSRGALRFADGTTGNEAYRGALEYDHNTDLMLFRTNGAQVMTLYDGGRLHPTGGVFLGSSNNDQLLSYYKEGNWEPEVYYQNATDQSNAVNVVSQGKFTRIGNLVFISFRLDFTQNGTPQADNIGVKNLPFNSANNHFNAGGNVITSTSLVGLFLQTPTAGQSVGIINTSDNLGNYGNNFGSGTGKFIRGNMTYLAQ